MRSISQDRRGRRLKTFQSDQNSEAIVKQTEKVPAKACSRLDRSTSPAPNEEDDSGDEVTNLKVHMANDRILGNDNIMQKRASLLQPFHIVQMLIPIGNPDIQDEKKQLQVRDPKFEPMNFISLKKWAIYLCHVSSAADNNGGRFTDRHNPLKQHVQSLLNTLGGGGRTAKALEKMQEGLKCLSESVQCSLRPYEMNKYYLYPDDCVKALRALDDIIAKMTKALREFGVFNTKNFHILHIVQGDLQRTTVRLNGEYGHHRCCVEEYLDSIFEPLVDDLEIYVKELTGVAEKEIPAIRQSQEFVTQRYLNLTMIATFLSSVTATTLQITAGGPASVLNIITNSFCFVSLVFSSASAIYSLLVMIWRQSPIRRPDRSLPLLAHFWLRNGSMFALIVALMTFSVGLCLLAFLVTDQMGIASAVVPTALAGFHAQIILFLSACSILLKLQSLASAFSSTVTIYDVGKTFEILKTIVIPDEGLVKQVLWNPNKNIRAYWRHGRREQGDLLVKSSKGVFMYSLARPAESHMINIRSLDRAAGTIRWICEEDNGLGSLKVFEACSFDTRLVSSSNNNSMGKDSNCKELDSYDLSELANIEVALDAAFYKEDRIICLAKTETHETQLLVIDRYNMSITQSYSAHSSHRFFTVSQKSGRILILGAETTDAIELEGSARVETLAVGCFGKDDNMVFDVIDSKLAIFHRLSKPHSISTSWLHEITTPSQNANPRNFVSFALGHHLDVSCPYLFAFGNKDGSVKVWSILTNRALEKCESAEPFEVHDQRDGRTSISTGRFLNLSPPVAPPPARLTKTVEASG
ncbi:hypothetical protein ACEPAI_8131 [Sanghuangporus weigelae]